MQITFRQSIEIDERNTQRRVIDNVLYFEPILNQNNDGVIQFTTPVGDVQFITVDKGNYIYEGQAWEFCIVR